MSSTSCSAPPSPVPLLAATTESAAARTLVKVSQRASTSCSETSKSTKRPEIEVSEDHRDGPLPTPPTPAAAALPSGPSSHSQPGPASPRLATVDPACLHPLYAEIDRLNAVVHSLQARVHGLEGVLSFVLADPRPYHPLAHPAPGAPPPPPPPPPPLPSANAVSPRPHFSYPFCPRPPPALDPHGASGFPRPFPVPPPPPLPPNSSSSYHPVTSTTTTNALHLTNHPGVLPDRSPATPRHHEGLLIGPRSLAATGPSGGGGDGIVSGPLGHVTPIVVPLLPTAAGELEGVQSSPRPWKRLRPSLNEGGRPSSSRSEDEALRPAAPGGSQRASFEQGPTVSGSSRTSPLMIAASIDEGGATATRTKRRGSSSLEKLLTSSSSSSASSHAPPPPPPAATAHDDVNDFAGSRMGWTET
ncbi:hypothetical protein JCM11491_001511 [Sporobolomyces phaffii]